MAVSLRASSKPNLVFFRPKYGPSVPAFQLTHRDEHARCLAQFFNLTVVDSDCDYAQVCDRHEPAASLFEIGLQPWDTRPPRVHNARSRDAIPRLALINADAWGSTRSRILAELQSMDFDAAFAICTTTGEHFPELKDRLYYWPNFIDEDIFHIPPNQEKTELVLLTGYMGDEYPWRKGVRDALRGSVSTVQSHHAGYADHRVTSKMPIGSDYARLIGSAWFAPTCGTVANELVRKHLEVPAVGTCLISQPSAALERAGFVDMRNVVFADKHDVVDKVMHLRRNADDLRRIILSGHDLVHTRHTMRNRSQIYDWVRLRKQASAAGARIVQPDPFGALVLQPTGSEQPRSLHVQGRGAHLVAIAETVRRLDTGPFEAAVPMVEQCRQMAPNMPEVALLQAYCDLQSGHAAQALEAIVRLLKTTLNASESTPPDPVEWAYLLIALLAMGRTRAALKHASQFMEISHPELDRARAAVFVVCKAVPQPLAASKRLSVHARPDKPLASWMNWLAAVLERSGHSAAAECLKAFEWHEAETTTDIFSVIRARTASVRQVTPRDAGRLRRWDDPLLTSTALRRTRRLLSNLSRPFAGFATPKP
jgi:hypothetical protein